MLVIYSFARGWLFLAVTLLLLCACFVVGLRPLAGVKERSAFTVAVAVAVALGAVYIGIYPSSSQDVFHNIASARILGVYGENPLITPPAAHPDDPLVQQVRAWRDVSSFYGPLFYAVSVIPAKLAGDDVLLNLVAFKAFNALALLALALLVGEAAERLRRGARTQAFVMIGWNPMLLYEHVGNAHNDVFMMLVAAGELLLAARGAVIAGLVGSALSALVKYPAAPLAAVIWLWSWKRADRRGRTHLMGLAVAAAALAAAVLLLFASQLEIGKEAAIGRPPVRALVALLAPALHPFGENVALSVARLLCWGAFLAASTLALRQVDRSPRSLFMVAFWVMAALTLVTVRQIYPSYLIWFVALGAILVGTTAWRITLLASISGLLSNLVFTDWSTWNSADDLAFVAAFVGLPLLLVIGSSRLRPGFWPPRLAAPHPPQPELRSESP